MRYNESMDIVTLTLNPCLDRTAWVGDFGLPPTREEWQTGGKGVNVARVLSALGAEALAVCPLGGETGERFCALARQEGIHVLPVPVSAPTRVIDTWAREGDFAQKVDYRPGAPLSETEMDALEEALFAALPGARALAVCGSAPDLSLIHISSSTEKKPSLRICGTEELSPGMMRILSPGTMPSSMKRLAVSAPMPSLSPLTEATACSLTESITRSNMTNGMPESARRRIVTSRVLSLSLIHI